MGERAQSLMSNASESVSIWLDKWRGKLQGAANEEQQPLNQTSPQLAHSNTVNERKTLLKEYMYEKSREFV